MGTRGLPRAAVARVTRPEIGEVMSQRTTRIRRGRHVGWWAEGRRANGRLFMMTWWPTEGLARGVARLFA